MQEEYYYQEQDDMQQFITSDEGRCYEEEMSKRAAKMFRDVLEMGWGK